MNDGEPSPRKVNFLRQFRNKTNNEFTDISASQFLIIYDHYDTDGNGYIEGEELDDFLKEFVSSVCPSDVGTEVVSEAMLAELKTDFLDAYDDNGDGKIEIRELAQLLPTDENFLLLFQLDNRLSSSIDFMKDFLKGLLAKAKGSDPAALNDGKMDEYVKAILAIFDDNKDGKLQLSEMARLLPVKENVLSTALTKGFLAGTKEVSYAEIERIFTCYDADKSGSLEGEEISGFLKDMLELMKPSYTAADLSSFESMLMKSCDLDGDGAICKEELTMMLLGIQKFRKH